MSTVAKDELDAGASDGLVEASYCTKVGDFFSPAASDLIGRYLGHFLEQLVITPTELTHSAKYQRRLHDAGRTLMNTVDRIGSLQARFKKESPSKRVRQLHELVSAATKKVWDDEKERPLPPIKVETFLDLTAAVKGADQERDYAINRMLAELLSQYKVWKDKIAVLVELVRLSKDRPENRHVEWMLGECLRSDAALDQLLGMPERLETRCNDLIDLCKGEWQPRDTAAEVAADLNALIAEGAVPSVRAGLEHALLRALAGKMALRSAEPEVEIQALYELFRRMWVNNSLLGGTKALALLEKRQARYINAEGVTDLLRERKVLADRIAYLFVLAGLTIGPANRTTIKTFIEHYFKDRDFVPRVISGQDPPVPKLQTFTATHRSIRTSWLSDEEKGQYCTLIEAAQLEMIKRSRLFEQVDKKGGGPSQKVLTLLDLCRKGTFIDGKNMGTVRQVVERYLADPQFLPDYLGHAQGEERERKMALLFKTLSAFGMRAPGPG